MVGLTQSFVLFLGIKQLQLNADWLVTLPPSLSHEKVQYAVNVVACS